MNFKQKYHLKFDNHVVRKALVSTEVYFPPCIHRHKIELVGELSYLLLSGQNIIIKLGSYLEPLGMLVLFSVPDNIFQTISIFC